jgi:hypothetical protein
MLYDEAVRLACTHADTNHDVIWNGIRECLNQGFLHAIQKEHPRLPDILCVAPLTPTTVQNIHVTTLALVPLEILVLTPLTPLTMTLIKRRTMMVRITVTYIN